MSLDPPYGERDPGDMAGRIDGIPEQIEAALERMAASPWKHRDRPAALAVGGMGGSAIAADLTFDLYADAMPFPLIVVRDYHWPKAVTRDALAVLCSYSGDTEETLSLYRDAGERGTARAAITTGGALARACERDGVPWAEVPAGSPPRAALFSTWVPLTFLVHAVGGCDDPAPDWRDAVTRLRALRERIGTQVPESVNPVKQMARRLAARHLYIYGGIPRTAAAATRFRQQINENAKLPAHSAVAPELNHNEIVAWERPDAFHHRLGVIVLRDVEDSPEVAIRLELTADYARRQGAEVQVFDSQPGGRLARLAAQVMVGDTLSLYLALARGVDPTPVASIDEFKRRLAEARPKREC